MKHLFSEHWTDLVFTNRNKQYGAYELRKLSDHNQLTGLVVANVVFVFLISFYSIITAHRDKEELSSNVMKSNVERTAENEAKPKQKLAYKSVGVEILPNINFDFLRILPDKEIIEPEVEYPELKKGIISYSVDPKTGRQYNPDKSAEFKEGMNRFYMNVTNNISFFSTSGNPNYNKGDDEIDFEINTLVFIQCEINEKGKLDSVSIFKGASDPKFNNRILEAFKKNDTWTAAIHRGKPVRQTMIVPYHFYYRQPLIKYYDFDSF